MPVHDWGRVNPSIFQDFHQVWTIEIRNALNRGALPAGFFAMTDRPAGGRIPDVITLQNDPHGADGHSTGGLAVAEVPPKARFVRSAEPDIYASRANRISIRHQLGHVVAIIEILSPGNKSGQRAIRSFIEKTAEFLNDGINLLVVDLFRPTSRDPNGIHKETWDEIYDEPYEQPTDKPLTVAAYLAGVPMKAFVEPIAVGDELPSLPIFLDHMTYVPAPLETTYQKAWEECPPPMRELILNPAAS